jgi:hypothetical protein
MFQETVRRLLELSPVGLTNDQLLWRFKRSGITPRADEILQTLDALAKTGVIKLSEGRRWRLASFSKPNAGTPGIASSVNPGSAPRAKILRAISASILRRPRLADAAPLLDERPVTGFELADLDWRKLVAYYAATQRLDTRGRVDERADRHGLSWQLFRANGCWWEECSLSFSTDILPPTFREALMRRPAAACSIGYPVSLFDQSGVPAFAPALLLSATYQLDGAGLKVELAGSEPVVNPIWLDQVVRRTKWQKDKLEEALFPEGEDGDFSDVVLRLGNCLATFGGDFLRLAELAGEVTVHGEGLRNVAALFLPSDDRFTQGAERDLDAIKDWSDEWLRETALWALVRERKAPPPVIHLAKAADYALPCPSTTLTDRQYNAALSALTGPLTLIQGPPGTGKSEVILSLITSIILSGGTAVIASKNHQALDEVETRLSKLVNSTPVMTRGRDSDGERDTNFVGQMRILAEGDIQSGLADDEPPVTTVLGQSRELLDAMQQHRRQISLNLEISELTERLGRWNEIQDVNNATQPSKSNALKRLISRIKRMLRRRPIEAAETREDIEIRLLALRRGQATQQLPCLTQELDALAGAVAGKVTSILKPWAMHITMPNQANKRALAERLTELQFSQRKGVQHLTPEDARLILRHRPIWAISTLSVASRVPLIPALFDYVIFDEASQCDIASAIPLFARARKAVVVGDPMQLGFIPQLSVRQEHALMDAVGLSKAGRHVFAQSANSLFDLLLRRGVARWHFLADQFRSAPEIVTYLNDAFYHGRLVASQDDRRAKWPDGYKPGLAWVDVPGRTTREDGGNINHSEANKIVQLVTDMVRNKGFNGSIGVLSPFNAQVALLMRQLKAGLTETDRSAVNLRISTIDKFQGGEADVVIFSPVVAEGAQQSAITFYERERRRLNVAISRARSLCIIVGDKAFARRSRVRTLSFLAEATERHPKPREPFESEWERRLYMALKIRGLEAFPQYPVGS